MLIQLQTCHNFNYNQHKDQRIIIINKKINIIIIQMINNNMLKSIYQHKNKLINIKISTTIF